MKAYYGLRARARQGDRTKHQGQLEAQKQEARRRILTLVCSLRVFNTQVPDAGSVG